MTITLSCCQTFSLGSDFNFLRARVSEEQVSRHGVVTTDACRTSLGAVCNGQAASGFWTGPRLQWYINCLKLFAEPVPVSAVASGQARVGPDGQHCDSGVYQPPRWSTLTSLSQLFHHLLLWSQQRLRWHLYSAKVLSRQLTLR